MGRTSRGHDIERPNRRRAAHSRVNLRQGGSVENSRLSPNAVRALALVVLGAGVAVVVAGGIRGADAPISMPEPIPPTAATQHSSTLAPPIATSVPLVVVPPASSPPQTSVTASASSRRSDVTSARVRTRQRAPEARATTSAARPSATTRATDLVTAACQRSAAECFAASGMTFNSSDLDHANDWAVPDCLVFHTETGLYEWVKGPCQAKIVP